MKPVRVVALLTISRFALLCFFITTISLHVKAQCSAPNKISYNVILNGTGNNSWGFVFPKFDPSVGTLVAVDIRAIVSVNVNFQLSNVGAGPDSYTVLAGRNENLSVSALGAPISSAFPQDYGPYNLQAGQDTVGAGTVASPQFFSLMNGYNLNDSITSAVAGFLGTGWVVFNNNPYTYAAVISGSNYSLNTTVSDTMKISLTYYYCTSNILASDITSFSVTKESPSLAKLTWDTENEISGRTYEVEESSDGKKFTDIASMVSQVNGSGTSAYDFNYPIAGGTTGTLYFRLKEINAHGQTKYSEIRSIEIDNTNGIYIYPNPANSFINILINEPGSSGWQATIFAADGRLVQRNELINSSPAHIDFIRQLAKGAYFLRLNNRDSGKVHVLPFIVY